MYWGIKVDYALIIVFIIIIIAGYALGTSVKAQMLTNLVTFMFTGFMFILLSVTIAGVLIVRNNPHYSAILDKEFNYEFGPTTDAANFKSPIVYTIHELNRVIPT
jgi:hypothetical protein